MTMISNIRTLTVLFGVAAATAAGAHGGKIHRPAAKPTPEESAAFRAAEPAFAQHCYRCHTRAGKKPNAKALKHMDMDRYPFGGHHASEAGGIVRKALGVGGGKATMPSDDKGAVSGDALAKVLAWADAFDRARGHGAAKKQAGGHDHTLEHAK